LGFIYSLANALISQPWTSEQVRAQLKPSSLEPSLRIPGLADRILIAFKETPEFDSLKDFLKADAGLARALGRTITPLRFKRLSPKKPGPSPRPAWLGTLKLPDLPTEAARSRKRLATLVAVIAADEGFSLNHRKTRLMRKSVRQHVTGVVVNLRPNIPRAEFDRLKAILTNCIRHGTAAQNRDNRPDFRAHLAGKLSHVQAVHPLRGQKLWNLFEQINWAGRE
jgi:hypothetical protein